MTQHLVILTGASRGLGHAMAAQWLEKPGVTLLCISRNESASLAANGDGATLEQWSQDLARPVEAASRLRAYLGGFDAARYDTATLVNNAALVTPPGPVEDCDDATLSASMRVGLEAPVLLTSAFLLATEGWRARREGECKVLNISSGLGRRGMAASAPYCAVKAGLDNFSRSVALDEAAKPFGARLVSIAPGIIDTDMQTQLREADPAKFPDRDLFVAFKARGELQTPEDTARKLIGYLGRADFGDKPLDDIRSA